MKVYLDYNATTPTREEVASYMKEYISTGNPSSIHWSGREARTLIDDARDSISKILRCTPYQIIFTSCGTESNNLAIKGLAFKKEKGHIISTKVEHPSVLNTLRFLERYGFSVTYIGVDRYGMPDVDEIKKNIRRDTFLITVMFVNNETGNIFPVNEIRKIAKENGIIFHTDAVQALGKLELNLTNLADMVSFSFHKIYGPKGVGLLFVNDGVVLEPILHGGYQEEGLRGGTQNVTGIVGAAKALELIEKEREDIMKRITKLRDMFERAVLSEIPGTFINGHIENRVPSTSNIGFEGIDSETMLIALDIEGIAASSGSACSTGSIEPSHVLIAMGLGEDKAKSSIRFSFGKYTTEEEIIYTIKTLKKVTERLRK